MEMRPVHFLMLFLTSLSYLSMVAGNLGGNFILGCQSQGFFDNCNAGSSLTASIPLTVLLTGLGVMALLKRVVI
ncbi:hypothetical protein AC249_AIPGENE13065 [Exaiptasia diaphana]|nr:hypothetical protein AC249_AIPGENE13065 [Exaiptasia diaphana]